MMELGKRMETYKQDGSSQIKQSGRSKNGAALVCSKK
jgi:hypothetical protein